MSVKDAVGAWFLRRHRRERCDPKPYTRPCGEQSEGQRLSHEGVQQRHSLQATNIVRTMKYTLLDSSTPKGEQEALSEPSWRLPSLPQHWLNQGLRHGDDLPTTRLSSTASRSRRQRALRNKARVEGSTKGAKMVRHWSTGQRSILDRGARAGRARAHAEAGRQAAPRLRTCSVSGLSLRLTPNDMPLMSRASR